MGFVRALPLFALVGLVAACAGGSGADHTSEDVAPIVQPAVHVMEGEDFDVEPDRIVTSRARAPELAKRAPGDVLVSSRGILRKVKSVTPIGDAVALETEPGILDDVFEQARVRGSVASATPALAAPSAGDRVTPLTTDVTLPKIAVGQRRIAIGEGSFIEIVDGEIDYHPTLDLDLSMHSARLERLKLVAGGDAHAKLHVRYELKKPLRRDSSPFVRLNAIQGIELASTPPAYGVFWAGAVPVVVSVRLRLLAGWDVSVGGDLAGEQSMRADGAATLGLSYEDGGWHDVSSRGMSISRDGHDTLVSQVARGDVTLTARLDVSFYETAGPYVGLQAYAGIREEGEGSARPTWFTEAGLRGIAGAQVAIFGHSVVGYETTFFDLHEQTPL
jgi:hypothetical protein